MVQKETLESNGLSPILVCFLTGPVTLGKSLAISQLQLSLLSNGYGLGSDLIWMGYICT